MFMQGLPMRAVYESPTEVSHITVKTSAVHIWAACGLYTHLS